MKKFILPILVALLISSIPASFAAAPSLITPQIQKASISYALQDINAARKKVKKPKLILNAELSHIAELHSQDMAQNIKKMSHDGFLGETAHERIKQGKVPDPEKKLLTNVLFPSNIARSGENVGMRNIKNFGWNGKSTTLLSSIKKAIKSQHAYFLNEPNTGITHRTTMLSTEIPFSEIGIGLYLEPNGNLWITEDFISH